MALTDTLDIEAKISVIGTLLRNMGTGNHTGTDRIQYIKEYEITDGSGNGNATGWFDSKITVSTSLNTISLADYPDPTGALGDDSQTEDPEGKKLRLILIHNTDTTNYVTFGLGTNALTNVLTGTAPSVKIQPGGLILYSAPNGVDAMNDGVDDEITLQANTASCVVEIIYIFG